MNDNQLIRACQQNDRTAQRLMVEQYSPLLYSISLRYAPDASFAKDILQEGLIRVFKNIHQFDPAKGKLKSWLCKIIINAALTHYKKLRYDTEVYGLDAPDHVEIPDVYAQLGAEELMKLIGQLPEGYRLVFNLSIIEGYSHKEIAELLNIKEASSRSQLQRARKHLQAIILKEENEYYESRAI